MGARPLSALAGYPHVHATPTRRDLSASDFTFVNAMRASRRGHAL
jgi:hypothetical protein